MVYIYYINAYGFAGYAVTSGVKNPGGALI